MIAMSMVVKNNLAALNTLHTLGRNDNELTKQLQKASTGMKINGAADDASAYAISERMRVQLRGLDAAHTNTQNTCSLMRVAEGAVSSTVDLLKTFKAKAINAANDTNTDSDRAIIQKELDQYMSQIDDNALVTFNGKYLLNGSQGRNIVADQWDAIVSFMSYLDNSTLSAQATLDNAIKYTSCGMFENESALIESFLSDISAQGLDACGINLDNDDTGAITGFDAGNQQVKTASSIVPEKGYPYGGGASGTSQINGLTVTWPDAAGDNMKNAIMSALDSQWLKNCISLVDESYAINFWENDTSVKTMNVQFSNANDGKLAYVSYVPGSNGLASSLSLNINMYYYGNLDLSNENGAVAGNSHQLYLDRTLAHEVTHALMAANIKNFGDMPLYIAEGTAELVHGIDDYRAGTIRNLVSNQTALRSALENRTSTATGDNEYAAGYMLLRYLAQKSADAEPEKHMSFQTGTKANQCLRVGLADMRCEALGLKKADGTKVSVTTQEKANSALTVIDRAIGRALKQQTLLGAMQSRLEYTAANITTAHENVTASESVIRDANMAKTFTDYTRANVLRQTAQSMLAQANQNSSNVLTLLQ